jgi:hypothetical protein
VEIQDFNQIGIGVIAARKEDTFVLCLGGKSFGEGNAGVNSRNEIHSQARGGYRFRGGGADSGDFQVFETF